MLQRCFDSAGVEQPASQLLFTHLQLTGGLHFDQRAVGTRLHPHARCVLGGVRRVVQREPFDVGQCAVGVGLRSFAGQGVSLLVAGSIEYAHIAEVALPCIQLHGQRQFKAIPRALATYRQRYLCGEVRRFFLSDGCQRHAHRNSAQPAQVQLLTQDDTPSVSGAGLSASGTASTRLGGNGAK
ncbi:hypothetical protein D3C85_702140 [compost metagenome]